MKRAPIVLAATAAGLGATLGFSPHAKAPTAAAVTTSAPSTSTSTSTSTSSSSSSSSSSAAKSATSDAISTQYGPVQLKVTVSAAGKITKVEAVQLPSSDPKSTEISTYAEPLLQQSALTKQSANIDAVSGATYTSDGYKTALQSALDKAGFTAATTAPAS